MGKLVQLSGNFRPTSLMRRMLKGSHHISEGTKHKLVAVRSILGKRVEFYHNGLRKVVSVNLDEQDEHDSEILRFAHASILTKTPQGDKKILYVDASVNPVEVWLYGMTAKKYLASAKMAVETGVLDPDFLLEEPLKGLKNV